MMVMTRVSERPVTEPAGTIGAVVCAGIVLARARLRLAPRPPPAWAADARTLDCVRIGRSAAPS